MTKLEARCLDALRRIDHTLATHGHIDAETELHKLIQDILYPGSPNEDPSGQRREAMTADPRDDQEPFPTIYAYGSDVVHAENCQCGACESYRETMAREPR